MNSKIKNKRGISPVVATVLLITISIIVIAIIFIWARSAIQEGDLKFGERISTACEDLSLDVDLAGNNLAVVNIGSRVALHRVVVKDSSGDLYTCQELDLSPGEAESFYVDASCKNNNNDFITSGSDIESVIPVLKTDDEIAYNCEKNEIEIF